MLVEVLKIWIAERASRGNDDIKGQKYEDGMS